MAALQESGSPGRPGLSNPSKRAPSPGTLWRLTSSFPMQCMLPYAMHHLKDKPVKKSTNGTDPTLGNGLLNPDCGQRTVSYNYCMLLRRTNCCDSAILVTNLVSQVEEQGRTKRRMLSKRGCFGKVWGSRGIGAAHSPARGRRVLL
jgi:hypothetical protein